MRYAIYSEVDGRILRIIVCSPADAAANVGPGEALMQADIGIDDLTHYIHGAAMVPIPSRTSPNTVFDYTTKQWADQRTLQEVKDAKWKSIKASREGAIDAPLTTIYGTFDSKAKDRANITDAVLMLQTLTGLGTPTNIDFTLSDNTTVTLTTAQMVAVGLLLGQKVQAAHSKARTLRTQINAATTAAQLETITW